MSESAGSASLNQPRRERAGLPRYYLITAIIVAMILVLAGGAIYYRLALNGIVERMHRDNLAFAQQIDRLANRAVTSSTIPPELAEQAEAEMAARPVVKISVYSNWRIRFSTDPSEIGRMLPQEERYYYYYDNQSRGSLTHYPIFETGEETLESRDLVVTRVRIGANWENDGTTIYADPTGELRQAGLTAAAVVAGLEVLLAVVLIVTLRRQP